MKMISMVVNILRLLLDPKNNQRFQYIILSIWGECIDYSTIKIKEYNIWIKEELARGGQDSNQF